MDIKENISLKKYNTFGINAKARFFLEINSEADLRNALALKEYPQKYIISGGSNMLLTKDVDALVLHMNTKGISVVKDMEDAVILKIMAGENWHQLVLWTLDHDYGGLENLSLIPGNTGTAPIQNIGAYGVELKDCFEYCEAMDVLDGTLKTFSKEMCAFGYRDSFFKNQGKNRYVILSVYLKLTKKNHKLNTAYGAIEAQLKQKNIEKPSIQDVSDAVIAIRKSKLPDPSKIGNSGSFFKNPIITSKAFDIFHKKYPEAPYYQVTEDRIKIPAGWLIEQCGFKGKRFGDAGVHANQALVLVNYGNATGQEILDLANTIMTSVEEKFNIHLQPEVNIIK